MMQPWRAVRANCSFAKLVLQAPYSTARTHAPTESYAMSFVYLPIYTPAIPVKPSCKDNGSFSAAACCFLSFLCNLSRPNYSSISCRSTIFHRVLSPFYLLIKSCVHIMYFCCLAGSHCVLGPQQWPQSFSNYTFSSATSVESLYKVIVSLFSCCSWCTN